MAFSKKRFRRKPKQGERTRKPPGNHTPPAPVNPETTGSECSYLKSLVDSRKKVTVVMNDGERLTGFVRYYDIDCFSIGITDEGPRYFLRKENISYIEDE